MLKDRFLLSILIGLAVLALAAVAVVLVRSHREGYVDDSTPAGVVHNYILALQRDDIQRAHSYLAEGEYRPSLSEFRSISAYTYGPMYTTSVHLGETFIDGDEAVVEVVVLNLQSGIFIFDEIYERDEVALLMRQDGEWRLTQLPFEFWMYEWYRQESIPIPVDAP